MKDPANRSARTSFSGSAANSSPNASAYSSGGAHSRIEAQATSGGAHPDAIRRAVAEWLETQGAVVAYWREVVVAAHADPELAADLDVHAAFLAQAARHHAQR